MSYLDTNKQAGKGNASGRAPTLELQTWRDYYLIIRERFFIGASIALLISGLVGYLLMRQPPVYEASAALLLDSQEERVLDMQKVVQTGLDGSGQMWRISLENHINQLMSRSFRGYVKDSLTEEEKEQMLAPYQSDPEPPSIGRVIRNVEVLSIPNSFILTITADHRDPKAAALLANRYVESYVRFNKERSQTGNQSAIAFLTEQEAELQEKLEKAEQELKEYQRRHNLVSIEENQTLIAQRLTGTNARLTEARMTRIQLESQLAQVEQFQKQGRNLLEIFSLSSVGSTPQVVHELDNLSKQREVMSERYGKQHPRMIANQLEIETAERLVKENIELAIANLRNQLSNALVHEGDLLVEMRQAEEDSLKLDELKVEYASMQRGIAAIRNTHAEILDRIDETSITSQLETSAIRIFDQASTPGTPVQPNLMRIGMLVIFLTGFLFFGAPIGLAALDSTLKHGRDVEEFLQEKLLGEISSVSNVKRTSRAHVVEEGREDRAVEGFRGLFSQLQLSSKKPIPKSLLVTSTIPSEGKSFVVNNLAFCFAAHGKRTLMIDFDLRRPSLHLAYSRMNNGGVLQWLENEECHTRDPDLEDLKIAEVAPNLFLLSSGGQTKKATETLGQPATERMIAALKKQFDVLIIDTPPLGVFPDALPLSQMVDESLYVVHFGKVDRQQVKNTVKRLKEANRNMVGVVMNGMPRGARFAHYYLGYGFGNEQYAKYYAAKR